MDIRLYDNRSDSKVVHKSLIPLGTFNVTLKIPTNNENPTFILNGDFGGNYIIAGEYRYFVTSKEKQLGGLVAYHCTIDPLGTIEPYLASITGLVERQEFVYNPELIDNEVKFEEEIEIGTILVGQCGTNNYRPYLSVVGV